ncbi:hypothetical protein ETD86_00310 [Nonomuraea turkmeniaca]|uniref:Integrase n=1 Tax=Nonomuraea turkmeniaca TaxID=103838 RepID=A0A5S4FY47_9ACTN|nr:hypothetical protein [Nonomuraea turkmeniaca]TMR25609.1 hypothetical protein ETD86_00310 [Nonomuraea turkmeniaca]
MISFLVAELGEHAAVTELEGEAGADRVAAWFADRWGAAASGIVNARLDALGSACAWWREQGWLTGDPLRRIRRVAQGYLPGVSRGLRRRRV